MRSIELNKVEPTIIYTLPGTRGGSNLTRRIKLDELKLMTQGQLEVLKQWVDSAIIAKQVSTDET